MSFASIVMLLLIPYAVLWPTPTAVPICWKVPNISFVIYSSRPRLFFNRTANCSASFAMFPRATLKRFSVSGAAIAD